MSKYGLNKIVFNTVMGENEGYMEESMWGKYPIIEIGNKAGDAGVMLSRRQVKFILPYLENFVNNGNILKT